MNKTIRRLTAALTGLITVLGGASSALPAAERSVTASAAGNLLAFPGAVGGGKYSTGGRGGEVYHVTNLNDSGEGSLRDAVSKSNRIVVFDVSGTIELKSNIICSGNITVAGQTAPGGSGVTLKNYKFGMGGDNIIVRYISSRPGPYASTSSGNDAWGGAKGSGSIIDHCSMGWTTDEQWGLYSANEYYTVQYSVLGPADSWGGHSKGLHGFGIMMGKGYLTFDHNLIIHNVSRNFRGKVEGQETADFTNNIIYDWGYQTAYGTIGHLNYVNNYLKAGKSTTGGYHWMNVDSTTKPQNFKVYCAGNKMLNKDGSVNAITNNNWDGVTVKDSIGITKNDLYSTSPFQTIVNGENVSTALTCESADAAYDHVIAYAGNGISSDKRTAIDRQCAEETRTGTGSCSGTSAYDGSVSDLNKYSINCGVTYTYPSAVLQKEITDADNDGMADDWERARGLDPTDPTDYAGDYCGQGYMNIEYYINDLTVDSFPAGVVALSPESDVPAGPSYPVISAFEKISADSFDEQQGVRVEEYSSNNNPVGYIENGDWVMYRKIDFGSGAKSFSAWMAGDPCTVELYLDSMNGEPAAKINYSGTGSLSNYQTFETNISQIKGIHNLYMKFTGGDGYLVNIKSFVFGENAIPLSGELFTNVEVAEQALPDYWSIGKNANTGSMIFGDRDFTIEQTNLIGAEILMTACSAKGTTGNTATFTAGADMTLHIALDSRVEKAPEWLADYTKMRTLLTATTDLNFVIYDKHIKKGEQVTLGSNGQTNQCVNFFALATPSGTSLPETVIGDINDDGEAGVADLVKLSAHLLGKTPLTAKECETADLTPDGRIDTFDLIALRKIVTRQ